MFNVIICEYVEIELEQIFASVIKPGTFDTNLSSKDKFTTHTDGNTLIEDT